MDQTTAPGARVADDRRPVLSATSAPPPGLDRSVLLTALAAVAAGFAADELAYLAVTSKVESPVRDRLAWGLHQRLADTGLRVAREWRRADIAVLADDAAVTLVEVKALYTFDVLRGPQRRRYLDMVRSDLAKAVTLAPGADAYALVLTTHVDGPITGPLRNVVKYAGGIAGALTRHGTEDRVRSQALTALGSELALLGAVSHVPMEAGRVFDLAVTVDAWLVGPVNHQGAP